MKRRFPRGFSAYLSVLVLNAVVDIAHKITIQNLLIKGFEGETLLYLSALVNALILLPFVLLFSPSGFVGDRWPKSLTMRRVADAGVLLALGATLCYHAGWFWAAFAMTLLLAVQSALYSPAKYGYLKEFVGTERLAQANGIVQAATVAAMLGSALLFSWLFEQLYNGAKTPAAILQSVAPLGWVMLLLALAEALVARRIPDTGIHDAARTFKPASWLRLRYLRTNLAHLRADRAIWLSVVGLALFWGVSQLIVALFPAYYKDVTGDDNTVIIQTIPALSAVGLMIGSWLAGRLSDRHIELGSVVPGALGIFFALTTLAGTADVHLMEIAGFAFGFAGAFVIVPLNAMIQYLAPTRLSGTILAGSNFVQNLVMIVALLLAAGAGALGFHAASLLHGAAWVALAGTLYALSQLPQLTVRLVLLPLLRLRYRLFVKGLEHLPPNGGVLLLGNHISWIDWLVLQIASPRSIKFVMERSIYEQWYLRWFLKWFDVIPISGMGSKGAVQKVRERLANGEVVALFPEGHISYNGQLGEFKRGFELIMKDADAPIVPFYLHGLWESTFSRAKSCYKLLNRTGGRRDVGVLFGAPLPPETTAAELKQQVRRLSQEAWQYTLSRSAPPPVQWLYRCKEAPFARAVVDAGGTDLNRLQMLSAVLLFIDALTPRLKNQKYVGVLLPASAAGAIVNMALMAMGRRPVNLNYTLSPEAMEAAVQKAGLQSVVSSETFLKKLKSRGFDPTALLGERLITAEEITAGFSKTKRIATLLSALLLPARLIEKFRFAPLSLEETATVLFSSGSEGSPKGIELTHKNLLANIKQVGAMLNFTDEDVILGSLPIFHSFGLTVTTLLPLCEGIPLACVPDPTDAHAVGKMTARYRATILFGTATFFRLYAKNRKLHPLMFESLRMAVAGAEKLKADVKEAFRLKFGVDLYEGYGTTETAPVVAVNMPDALDPDTLQVIVGHKPGSVGQPLPGTVVRIVDPQTLETLPARAEGLVLVGGPQVMRGYLDDPAKTAEALVELEGIRFYKTSDKGYLDEEGFLTIVDRYARFAKIGGEMVSLGAVEESAESILGEEVTAVNLADEKKGEKIILLYTGDIEPDAVIARLKAGGMAPLMVPAHVRKVASLPKLASGKTDFFGAKKLAASLNSDHKI